MITEKNNVFYCDCGFSFLRGHSGAHDCAVGLRNKLAKSEARCAALAAENAGLNNFIASSCYVLAGEEQDWHPAIDHSPEIPATNQLSVAESQFLTDVLTAAGLLSCGKRDKQLAQRLADFCVSKRGDSSPAQLRKGVQS